MLKFKLAIYCLLGFCLINTIAQAEPFQDAFRYGTYGLVAGALAGGASMAISEDPGARLTPVARGASIGLYAGLIVALVNNMNDPSKRNFDIQPVTFKNGKSETIGLAFSKNF